MNTKKPSEQSTSEWLDSYKLLTGENEMIASDKGSGDFPQIPPGTKVSRCVRLIDLGTTHNDLYDNDQHKIYIGFETPTERSTWKDKDGIEHEGPFIAGKFYTLSLNEKANLRKDLEAWRGKEFTQEELSGFAMKNILDKTPMLNIIQKEKNGKKLNFEKKKKY